MFESAAFPLSPSANAIFCPTFSIAIKSDGDNVKVVREVEVGVGDIYRIRKTESIVRMEKTYLFILFDKHDDYSFEFFFVNRYEGPKY